MIGEKWHLCSAGGAQDSERSARDTDSETAGVQRALVESVLRLSCVDSVLADMHQSLGPVPAGQEHAYNLTRELYGTTRMLLACLPKADLAKVGSYGMLSICSTLIGPSSTRHSCIAGVLRIAPVMLLVYS